MWIWVVLALACGDVSGVYLLGLGLTGVLASRRTRRPGLALGAAGVGWVLLATATGNNMGSHIADGYAYLSDQPMLPEGIAGITMLTSGALKHPSRPLDLHALTLPIILLGGSDLPSLDGTSADAPLQP